MAVSVVSIPAFLLNKYWVWDEAGRAHMRREVLPFWLFTVAGLALSTLFVVAAAQGDYQHGEPARQPLAVQAANIAGFGVLWVLSICSSTRSCSVPTTTRPTTGRPRAEEALERARLKGVPGAGRSLNPDIDPRP